MKTFSMLLMPLIVSTSFGGTAASAATPPPKTDPKSEAKDCNGALKNSTFPRVMSEWVVGAQTPNYFASSIAEMRMHLDGVVKRILNIEPADRTFENTILAADAAIDRYKAQGVSLQSIYALLPATEDSKTEFKEFSQLLAEGESKFYTSAALAKAFEETKVAAGSEQELRFALLAKFEKAGASGADDVREKISALASERAGLEADYDDAIQNDATTVTLTGEELAGLAPEFLKKLSEEKMLVDGVLNLPVGDPSLITTYVRQASSEAARSKAFNAYRARLPENMDRLLRVTQINYETSQLLKKRSQLDIAVEKSSLAGVPETVTQLLEQLRAGFKPAMQNRMARLADMKKAEGATAPFNMADAYYYENKLQNKDQAFEAEVTKYFRAGTFNREFIRVLRDMFGIEFTEVTDEPVWHPSVKLYRLTDLKTAKPIGHMYLDNYSRLGKNSSTAFVEEMISHRVFPDGKERLPVVLFVTNWGPYENRDSLNISLNDVLTALHEMGHALHATFQQSPFFTTSGFSIPTDMVEVPSTTLELMGKRAEMLMALSAYEGDPSKKMPLAMAEKVAESLRGFSLLSGDFHSSSHEFNTVFLSEFDQEVQLQAAHLQSADDIMAIYRRMFKDFFGFEPDPTDRFPQTYHHIAGQYAGYYGAYIVARVGAANNIAHLDKRGGIMNPKAVREWREQVLQAPAYELGSAQLQRNYLGHEISTAPTFEELNFAQP